MKNNQGVALGGEGSFVVSSAATRDIAAPVKSTIFSPPRTKTAPTMAPATDEKEIGSKTRLSVVARRSSGTAVARSANTIEIAVAVAAPSATAPTVSHTRLGASARPARLAAASTQAPASSGRKPYLSPAAPASGDRSAPRSAD